MKYTEHIRNKKKEKNEFIKRLNDNNLNSDDSKEALCKAILI